MKEKIREKSTNFIELWKAFWNPEEIEETTEEKILKDNSITDDIKSEFLKALADEEKLVNKMFASSYKTTKLEIKNHKIAAEESIEKKKEKEKNNTKGKVIGE